MSATRQGVSIMLGISLTFSAAAGAGMAGEPAAILGVVTHSEGGHIGDIDLSEGTTIYEGDRLSTEEDGRLAVHARMANLQLGSQSSVTVRQTNGGGVAAELIAGTLVFSAARATGMELRADGALVRPEADVATVATVRVIGPKELEILARRGSLEFSYRDQSALIPESTGYRIVLDPPDDSEGPESAPRKTAARQHTTFLLIALGAAGVAAVATHIPKKRRPHESPFQP